jgi:hypothetical protein
MVNRVRKVVTGDLLKHTDSARSEIEITIVKGVVRRKFLSWNAASAAQIKVIEYLEELVDIAKLLVSANEFRSEILTRPTYREYVDRLDRSAKKIERSEDEFGMDREEERMVADEQNRCLPKVMDLMPEVPEKKTGLKPRRMTFSKREEGSEKKPRDDQEF